MSPTVLPLNSILKGLPTLLPIKSREEMNSAELAEIDYYEKQANSGDTDGEFLTGLCSFTGYGTPKNYGVAVTWYLRASAQGHAMAEYNLGACYAGGFGVSQDYVQSVKWYRRAAERGYAPAQFNLGCRYFAGEGVEKNLKEAES